MEIRIVQLKKMESISTYLSESAKHISTGIRLARISIHPASIRMGIVGAAVFFILNAVSFKGYLLFHSLTELMSVVIACSVFLLAWNARRILESANQNNYYLQYFGISCLFSASFDVLHLLSYKGMGIFQGFDANLPAQLWIAARFLQSVSLLLSLYFLRRKINPTAIFSVASVVSIVFLVSIFYWQNFPVSYMEGQGLTPFKIVSEYVISGLFVFALIALFARRGEFSPKFFGWFAISIVLMIFTEVAFTFYVDVFDFANKIGHFLKILSAFAMYQAVIVTGLAEPYNNLFKDLMKKEESLKKERDLLEERVTLRSAEVHESESILRSFYDSRGAMRGIIEVVGDDIRYVSGNIVLAEFLGQTKDSLRNKLASEIGHPAGDLKDCLAHCAEALKANSPVSFEVACIGNTRPQWMTVTLNYLGDSQNGLPRFSTAMSDITERKKLEETLEKQVARQRALRSVDMSILVAADLQSALATVMDEIRNYLGVDIGMILLYDPVTFMLETIQSFGLRQSQTERIRLGEGLIGKVALERKALLFSDITTTLIPELPESLKLEEIKGLRVLPLVAKGYLVGALVVAKRSPIHADQDWSDFLETMAGLAAMAINSARSFENLQRTNSELMRAYDATIEGWSRALELRDRETEGHSQRVTDATLRLAVAAGMSLNELVHVKRGALLHDIGKVGIPDSILLKPGILTENEWKIMRQHPTFAYEMLSHIPQLRPALDIPYCHHEKWDGGGYPRGLKGEQIPLSARLFTVVDVFDALRFDRPYRQGWSVEKTLDYIRSQSGSHFDPKAVELFFRVFGQKIDTI